MKVVQNEPMATQSAAYLAMWKALEAYDPQADEFSEPIDFGSKDDRRERAEQLIHRMLGLARGRKEIDQDVAEFRRLIDALRQDRSFTPEARKFYRRLRDKGTHLAQESLQRAASV